MVVLSALTLVDVWLSHNADEASVCAPAIAAALYLGQVHTQCFIEGLNRDSGARLKDYYGEFDEDDVRVCAETLMGHSRWQSPLPTRGQIVHGARTT